MPEYFTIKNNLINEMEIKKSRFITQLIKVNSESAAQEQLAAIKKAHRKANHSCSAYIIGQDSAIKRMSDDGEPAGTAGIPMLSVLEEHQLTNVLAVVTRYFGGIKLGKGGLIRAYSNSVSSVLTEEAIVQAVILQELQLTFPYNLLDSLVYDLEQQELKFTDIQYTEQVVATLWLPQPEVAKIILHLNEQFNGTVKIIELATELKEVPIKKD